MDRTLARRHGLRFHFTGTQPLQRKPAADSAIGAKRPMLHEALEKQCRKSRIPVDFSRAYWTPPLSPKLAYETERDQIENTLGLRAMVSLTDHDNIEAPVWLRSRCDSNTPISLEWSVPFAGTIFHLGVHNLPSGQAQATVQDLAAYTQNRMMCG